MTPHDAGTTQEDGRPAGLEVRVRSEVPFLDVELLADPGEVVAVVGPNGAGKSTLVHALAGLHEVSGTVRVGGATWQDDRGRLAARDRHVGMVFQDRLLFPHLSALDNVAFGLRSRGTRRHEADAQARAWLERLGIGELADRRPRRLSGGQAQRVAIARALAGSPDLLLLDEPLAALDVGVAAALRVELAGHLRRFPGVCVLVTHDALDALTLADRLVVVEDGRVSQQGPPDEVAQHPRSSHVARLVGLNVARGTAQGTLVTLADGREVRTAEAASGDVFVAFSPSAVALGAGEPQGSPRNRWHGAVGSLAPHGERIRVHATTDSGASVLADVTPAAATDLGLVPGRPVWMAVKATETRVYPSGGPAALG